MLKIAMVAMTIVVVVSGAACSDRAASAHAHAAMAAAEAARAEIARLEAEIIIDSVAGDVLERTLRPSTLRAKLGIPPRSTLPRPPARPKLLLRPPAFPM